jgi:exosome complex component RRP4
MATKEESKGYELVVPGDLIDDSKLKPGAGTYRIGNKIYASRLGIKSVRANYVNIVPLGGRYNPRPNDSVIGKVIDIGATSWLIDINSPYPAPLHVTEVPWNVEFGATSQYMTVGDLVLVKVSSVDEIKRVQVTMNGVGLRKLSGGYVIDISPSKVPRVIGKAGSMISIIKRYTKCRMFVGQNGWIWVDGGIEEMMLVAKVIKRIEEESHIAGLTAAVEQFLVDAIAKKLAKRTGDSHGEKLRRETTNK